MNFKIASYPGRGCPNPYIDLFYDALEPHGIELLGELKVNLDWLKENISRLDGIHLHWPETIWLNYYSNPSPKFRLFLRSNIPGAWRVYKYLDYLQNYDWYKKYIRLLNKIKGIFYLRKFLKTVKRHKKCIIWTFHNSEIHEGSDLIDQMGYYYLAQVADIIIFHSEIAKKDCISFFRPKHELVVMPHGNYIGVYPPPRPKDTILKDLRLNGDIPIVSCLGGLRDYKGLDIACEAIALLNGKVQFLCAGPPHPAFDLSSLENLISRLPKALLMPRLLTDQEFSDYASISDIILLPYRKITGSGALLAALSFSRSVVASDLPYFREIVGNAKTAALLVQKNNPQALADGILKLLKTDKADRQREAKLLAETFDWDKVITNVLPVLNHSRKTKNRNSQNI
jgi:beta-1,4-mannosyltransferase